MLAKTTLKAELLGPEAVSFGEHLFTVAGAVYEGLKGTPMAIPQLSSAQLEAARAAATEARRARANLKERVKNGDLSFTDALNKAVDDETLSRIKVVDLLRSMPRVGVTRAGEIMENLQIAPNRRIRGLGRHQVVRLTELFK